MPATIQAATGTVLVGFCSPGSTCRPHASPLPPLPVCERVHICISECDVCLCMCVFRCKCMHWRAEDVRVPIHHAPPYSSQTFLTEHRARLTARKLKRSPCLHLPDALVLQAHTWHVWFFYTGAGIQSQILMLEQQVFYPLNHLPSPKYSPSNKQLLFPEALPHWDSPGTLGLRSFLTAPGIMYQSALPV